TGEGAGVFFGGSTGGLYECERVYESHRRGRLARAPRGPIRRHLVQRPAEAVARLLGADGPVETVCSACASGTLAIGAAIDARRRGAAILAECAGAGASADAHHMTAPRPDGEGAARAITRALDEAGRPPSEVALINTHGTGTPLNDRAEFAA